MSEEKYMPPKILHHGVYPFDDMTKYIRADIVEEMREALEFCCELLESLGSTALRGRSAIKLLEEE